MTELLCPSLNWHSIHMEQEHHVQTLVWVVKLYTLGGYWFYSSFEVRLVPTLLNLILHNYHAGETFAWSNPDIEHQPTSSDDWRV